MTPSVRAHPVEDRELWRPDMAEQIKAAEVLLSHSLHPEARQAVRQRMLDWLAHAQGCRRRAHEYKRWALEYETAGNLVRYREYRSKSDKSWLMAKDALTHARRERNSLKGEFQWH